MKFSEPLMRGKLIKRYKRFLADIKLDDGREVTAHCANSGSMLGLNVPGAEVWISPANNPKRKLKYTWEMIKMENSLVGINTSLPNKIVQEAIENGDVEKLAGYPSLRREVKYGENSRVDILLEDEGLPTCYVEIKSVTMKRHDLAEFPDAVTTRGTKHLRELVNQVKKGDRAVMFYLVQREDCDRFTIAGDIDPGYAEALQAAKFGGVEVLCYSCRVRPEGISLSWKLPLDV